MGSSFLMVLVALLFQAFVFNMERVISLLLILEALMLILLIYLFFVLTQISGNPYMFLVVLTFSACEAALGLSILVSLMRFKGNDLVSGVISVKWFAKITFKSGRSWSSNSI